MNRQIIRLALPNIITNITVPLLGIVDLALMGHLDNPVYIGAIALGGTIFNIIYSGFSFLRMGSSGLTAQAFGAKNKEEVTLILQRSLLVGLALAAMLITLRYPIQWVALHLLDGTPEVKTLAREYFYIRIIAAPATLGLYAFYGWFLGVQNAIIPMILAVTVNMVNIALNFLFVKHFGMKSDGVAWASVIAQYSGLLLAGIFFLFRFKNYHLQFRLKQIIYPPALSKFFRVNRDIFIRTIVFLFVLAFFTSRSAKSGNNILAVNTLLFQLFYFFSYFADGFAYAAEALTGKAKGAGNRNELKAVIKGVFNWGWGIALAFTLIYAFGLNSIMALLSDNRYILQLAREYYFWTIIIPLISISAFSWDGIFIGATASRAMRNVSIVVSLFVFLPVYYAGSSFMGNHALWLAFDMFLVARSLGMWYYARKGVLYV